MSRVARGNTHYNAERFWMALRSETPAERLATELAAWWTDLTKTTAMIYGSTNRVPS